MLNLGDFHGVMSLPANLYEGLQFKMARKNKEIGKCSGFTWWWFVMPIFVGYRGIQGRYLVNWSIYVACTNN